MTLLKPREAAATLRLSEPTLKRFRVSGNGPKFIKLGRSIRYQKSVLDEWLVSKSVRSTSEAGRVR